jgi:ribosomal RNA-processing protein 12
MFEYQQKAEMEGRASEGKVWNVLIDQIWSGFAGYCISSPDLKSVRAFLELQKRNSADNLLKALNQQFSQLLSQLMYGQPELRAAVLKGLKVMVESNQQLAETSKTPASTLSAEQVQENLDFLRTQAGSWLAVFFNVFSSITPDSRNLVGETVAVWASIAQETVSGTSFKYSS